MSFLIYVTKQFRINIKYTLLNTNLDIVTITMRSMIYNKMSFCNKASTSVDLAGIKTLTKVVHKNVIKDLTKIEGPKI